MKREKPTERSVRRRILLTLLPVALVTCITGCWIKNIDTPYYTQETSYWCGAASAQMVLNSEEIGTYVSQSVLYDYIHPRNVCSGWASGPQALADALNHWYPSGNFYVSALSDQDDGVKKIAYTIDRYNVPPVSLIYGCGHWVVVRGVFTDVQPTSASSYTIYGFWVNDPWYGSTSLGENKYVDVSEWTGSYFTGCSWCARSGTRYISVVDPDPLQKVQLEYPTVRPRQDRVLSSDQIVRFAEEYRSQFTTQARRYEQFEPIRVALENTEMGRPMLVRRTDRKESAYFIVPFNRDRLTSGAVLLDAYSGQLLEATYVRRPIRYLDNLSEASARDLFERKLPVLEVQPELLRLLDVEVEPVEELPSVRPQVVPRLRLPRRMETFDRLDLAVEDVKITRMELVWEPSLESQNPYYPLWSVRGTVRDAPEATLGYVTAEGDVHTQLRPIRVLKGACGS